MSENKQTSEDIKGMNVFTDAQKPSKKRNPIKQIFITGIVALLPLVVTFYILRFMYNLIVSNLTPLFNRIVAMYNIPLPESASGVVTIVLFLLIVFLVGILTRLYLGRLIISLIEKTVTNIPIANVIYSAIKQMIDSVQATSNNFEKVVLVEFPHDGIYCVGLVVRKSQKLMDMVVGEPCYNVFVPTAPNPTSGFITIIPVNNCKELPLTVEEGVKFIFSVGLINTPNLEGLGAALRKNGE
ncbi:MAG: DUF502 domain-containing protein [Deferribacteraceae bacterium]|jgi:uncharacterized membrane protein|nr:DUF502 domain-containing protein [Deferribacteraceae bacterium]